MCKDDFLDSFEHGNKLKGSSGVEVKSQYEDIINDDFFDSLLGPDEDANQHEVLSRSVVERKPKEPFVDNFLDSLLALSHDTDVARERIMLAVQSSKLMLTYH